MMVSQADEGESVFFDCNSNETNNNINNNNICNEAGVDSANYDTDLWPLEDPNNNNNDCGEIDDPPDHPRQQEVVSSDDLLFDMGFLESLITGGSSDGRLDDNVTFLKTTHVTGHGVSCVVVSGEFSLYIYYTSYRPGRQTDRQWTNNHYLFTIL